MTSIIYDFVVEQDNDIVEGFIRPLPEGPWVAGGACLAWYNNTPSKTDIDVYFRDADQYHTLLERMQSPYTQFHTETLATTDNAVTLKMIHRKTSDTHVVQLIKKEYYNNINAVLDGFDITVCKIGWDGSRIHIRSTFAEDVKHRWLRFDNVSPTSHKRLVKYICYGYEPVPGTIQQIVNSPSIDWDHKGTDHYA